MAKKVKPLPEGYTALTPYLVVDAADKAISFYTKAFAARELDRMTDPAGKIVHAVLEIGGAKLLLSDEFDATTNRSPKTLKGSTASVYLYVPDVDAVYKRAVAAGARSLMPLTDMFWGDRFAKIEDPFGHQWELATKIEDVSPAEAKKRGLAFFSRVR
jgi:PhnB protein